MPLLSLSQVLFHDELLREKNLYRTTNAEIADFFLVPVYGECFLWQYEMLKKKGREQQKNSRKQYPNNSDKKRGSRSVRKYLHL